MRKIMPEIMPEIIGFDPGFGNSKGAYININGQMKTIQLPSVVGVGNTELGLLNTGQFNRQRNKNTPDKVSFGGITYLVGEHVANFARPVERMDFQRLADGPELRALFYTTMYRLLGEGIHNDLRIMVGLPVQVMQNKKWHGSPSYERWFTNYLDKSSALW